MSQAHDSVLKAKAGWIPHEAIYDRFEAAWLEIGTPDLADFLADVPAASRLEVLHELVKIDLEHRWKRGSGRRIEEYLQRFPELAPTGALPVDLVAEEIGVRRRCGNAPTIAELQSRFPSSLPLSIADLVRLDGESSVPDFPGSQRVTVASAFPATNTILESPAPIELGRYRVLETIGRGGFAIVYRAWDQELRRHVALKVPRREIIGDPGLDERFLREARAAAKLRHPAIVSLHEVGKQGDMTYLVYDLVPGPNLAELLKGTQPAPEQAAEWAARIADALDYAHREGIIHRDVKPANVLLDAGNQPMLADFGLVSCEDAGTGLTRTGDILGTPAYMSPEQAKGLSNAVDGRTDVYSLGVLLYETLCGVVPFQGQGASVLHKVIHDEPRTPRAHRSTVPMDLETICLKAMAKEPARRYATAGEFADDLRRYLRHEPIKARRIGPLSRAARWCRRNPALAATIFVAILAISLVAGFSFRRVVQERDRAQRLAANLALDRAIGLCDQDEVAHGLLWMAKALELTPADDAELRGAILANLGAWRKPMVRPRSVLKIGPNARIWRLDATGRRVFLRSQNTGRIFDLGEGRAQGELLVSTERIYSVALSPDNRMLVTGDQKGKVQFWEAATGQACEEAIHLDGPALTAAFSPRGDWLLLGTGKKVQRYDLATREFVGKPFAPHLGHRVVSPDGKTMLTCNDAAAFRYDAQTGEVQGTPLEHQSPCLQVAFSPKGRFILVWTRDRSVHLWNATTGERVLVVADVGFALESIALDDNEKRLAAPFEGSGVRIWNLDTGKPTVTLPMNKSSFLAAAFNRKGDLLATTSTDRIAQLWDAATGQKVAAPMSHPQSVLDVAFAPDDRSLLTICEDNTARLWDIDPAWQRVRTLVNPNAVWSAAFTPDGEHLAVGSGLEHPGPVGGAQLWHVRTGKPVGPPMRHGSKVNVVAFSPDGKTLVTGDYNLDDSTDSRLHFWETATGLKLGISELDAGSLSALAFSRDGRRLFSGNQRDGFAQEWDVATRKRTAGRLQHKGCVRSIDVSQDGKIILTGSYDQTAQLWDAESATPIGAPFQNPGAVGAAALSHDGRWVITGNDYRVALIFDAATAKPVGVPLPHHGTVRAVAFHPNGRVVLTGSRDRSARLWDRATGKPIGPALRHDGEIQVALFSPDGKTIATGGVDKTVRLWPMPSTVDGSSEHIRSWIEVLTGMELQDSGAIHALDAAAWESRRQRLEGLGGLLP